ncbi:MAG: hypothetical protein LBD08_01435 [Treponema sp.]|jgi:hypothetical protein|nr:hypothetical protein [Treponema sp.]
MWELLITEALTGVFLLLPLLRPLVKRLWPLDGLAWLPLFALAMLIGLFPAYGFRPECVPFLVYGIILNIINAPALIALVSRLQNDDFRERRTAQTLLSIAVLGAVMALALYFLPRSETALLSRGVKTITLQDEARGESLFVRVYGDAIGHAGGGADGMAGGDSGGDFAEAAAGADAEKARPLLILIPPVTGSVGMVDQVCGELRDRGFAVLTYSRRNFDLPARDDAGRSFGLPAARRFQLLGVLTQGLVYEKANAAGRALEDGRRQDIFFLLGAIRQQDEFRRELLGNADPDCIFLAGYGAGGAALLQIAGSPGFTRQYPAVKGLAAVESPILSALREPDQPQSSPLRLEGWFRSFVQAIRDRAAELSPRKVSGAVSLPNPGVPALFLLSDRALNSRHRETRYATLIPILQEMKEPAILAAARGAGPLDYSDVPRKYPLYRVLFPGAGKLQAAGGRLRPSAGRLKSAAGFETAGGGLMSAAIIANFAAVILERGETSARIPLRTDLSQEGIMLEAGRAWNFSTIGSIL